MPNDTPKIQLAIHFELVESAAKALLDHLTQHQGLALYEQPLPSIPVVGVTVDPGSGGGPSWVSLQTWVQTYKGVALLLGCPVLVRCRGEKVPGSSPVTPEQPKSDGGGGGGLAPGSGEATPEMASPRPGGLLSGGDDRQLGRPLDPVLQGLVASGCARSPEPSAELVTRIHDEEFVPLVYTRGPDEECMVLGRVELPLTPTTFEVAVDRLREVVGQPAASTEVAGGAYTIRDLQVSWSPSPGQYPVVVKPLHSKAASKAAPLPADPEPVGPESVGGTDDPFNTWARQVRQQLESTQPRTCPVGVGGLADLLLATLDTSSMCFDPVPEHASPGWLDQEDARSMVRIAFTRPDDTVAESTWAIRPAPSNPTPVDTIASEPLHADGVVVVVRKPFSLTKVLAVHRRENLEQRCLPGGRTEGDEAPRDAAARELREETGLELTAVGRTHMPWLGSFHMPGRTRPDGSPVVVSLYDASGWLAGCQAAASEPDLLPHWAELDALCDDVNGPYAESARWARVWLTRATATPIPTGRTTVSGPRLQSLPISAPGKAHAQLQRLRVKMGFIPEREATDPADRLGLPFASPDEAARAAVRGCSSCPQASARFDGERGATTCALLGGRIVAEGWSMPTSPPPGCPLVPARLPCTTPSCSGTLWTNPDLDTLWASTCAELVRAGLGIPEELTARMCDACRDQRGLWPLASAHVPKPYTKTADQLLWLTGAVRLRAAERSQAAEEKPTTGSDANVRLEPPTAQEAAGERDFGAELRARALALPTERGLHTLWGRAAALPDYDKQWWLNLQRKLEKRG